MSATVTRAALVAGDAATVLPYDPAADTVLLIEQFRFGPWVRGDLRPWTLEPVAGRIDPGESPEEAVRREAREEAGIGLDRLEKVAAYYPTTGAVSEYVHSFVGLCDLAGRAGTVAGSEAEDEDILSHVISFARLMDLVASGEAENGPLLLSAFWLAANRGRLRRE
jgi:nudix-type nucleoside diphosphatase (YffH/AdpP family)